MNPPTLVSAALLLLAAAAPAQNLYSHAIDNGSGGLLLSLKLRFASPGVTIAVSASAPNQHLVSAPSSITTDSAGYAALVIAVTGRQANTNNDRFTVTLSHPSLPGGALRRDYLVRTTGGQTASAWPEFLHLLGAFCNPTTDAQAHLQVDRTVDLDGDGIYGDINAEGTGFPFDQIDYPSEFSMDVNTQGSNGCLGGNPPGVFWPGSAGTGPGRRATFCADNRVVTGTCAFTTRMNRLRDADFSTDLSGNGPALLLTSWASDLIMIGRDSSGDGNLTDAEIKTFFDPRAVVNNEEYDPDGVAVDRTANNRVYWISDRSGALGSTANQGLFRLTDANGDDSISAGEVGRAWVGTTPTVAVEGVAIVPDDFEGLHVDGAGAVLLHDSTRGVIFRWTDANGNGTAETGEVANWLGYNTAATRPLPTASADFNSASFPPAVTSFRLKHLASVRLLIGGEIYFIGSDSSNTTELGGYIFRARDTNSDGDVNDLGEVTIFNDPTTFVGSDPPDWFTGMDAMGVDQDGNGLVQAHEVFVYGASPHGPRPRCGFAFQDLNDWRLVDLNGDGDAGDAGELTRISLHPTGGFNAALLLVPNPSAGGFRHTFYTRSTVVTTHAAACTTSTGRYLETSFVADKYEEGTQGTPFSQNSRFVAITRGNPVVGPAVAGIALGVSPLPLFPLFGCTLGLAPPFYLLPALTTVPNAQGDANFPVPVPANVNGDVLFQAYAADTAAIYLGEVARVRIR